MREQDGLHRQTAYTALLVALLLVVLLTLKLIFIRIQLPQNMNLVFSKLGEYVRGVEQDIDLDRCLLNLHS